MEYGLTATLKRPTRGVLFPSKDLEASHDLILRSRNYLQDVRPRPAEASSQIVKIDRDFHASQLVSDNGKKMSLLNRTILNTFAPSDLQPVIVTISVFLDRYVRPAGICRCLLRASREAIADSAKHTQMTPIKLRSYSVRLIARTALRAKLEAVMVQDVNHHAVDGRVLLSGKGLDLDVPWSKDDEGHATNPIPNASTSPPLDGWLDMSSTWPTYETDRQFMTPTFKTYNINREYALALEMKLECAGIKYDVKRDNIEVAILAVEDHAVNGNEQEVPRDDRMVEHGSAPLTDSKGALENDLNLDEKQGPVPPPSREVETEQLPQYEPGDVPVYHAGDESSRPV